MVKTIEKVKIPQELINNPVDFLTSLLHCSETFANYIIGQSQGDIDKLYDLFLYQFKKRHETPSITFIGVEK